MEINILNQKHKKKLLQHTKISKFEREKTEELGYDYWDNKNFPGYQGYYYDGRWLNPAKKIINHYNLNKNSKILDVGCGKGFFDK